MSHYDLGKNKIAIHDLPGQNLEEWIGTRISVFNKANLVIIMVDSTENWDDSEQLWLRFHRVNQKHNFKCKINILFHKIDLLDKKALLNLKNKIQNYNFTPMNAFPYLTSIEKSYFSQTLTHVIKILKETIHSNRKTLDHDVMKLNFLEKAVNSRFIRFADLALPDIDIDEMVSLYFKDLEELGYLVIDYNMKSLRITNKGREFVEKYKNRVFHRIMDNQSSFFTFLKGFILSDKYGRSFFHYESSENIFKELFAQLGENVDPTLIAGFFFTTIQFGEIIDKSGMKVIDMKGQNVQIQIVTDEELFGIFFLDYTIVIDKEITEIVTDYLLHFSAKFKSEILKFLKIGDLGEFQRVDGAIHATILKLIEHLSEKISNQIKEFEQYSQIGSDQKLGSTERRDQKKAMFNKMLSYR